MGAMQNNPPERKAGGKKRGSTNNDNRLSAFTRGAKANGADWGDSSPEKLQAVIVGITSMGGAVTFGLSRDKGAHSLTLMLDDGRQTLWFNGDADLNADLTSVINTLDALAD